MAAIFHHKKETKEEPSWHELLGSKNWEGLIDPLNVSLRHLIVRCGDFCQATYDSFNTDENSKYAGASRYGRKSFFSKVMLINASDYQINCFLYATAKLDFLQAVFFHPLSRESWDSESNFMGYIATTTDEVSQALGRRQIYVVWRGTNTTYESINNLAALPESAKVLVNPDNNSKNNWNVLGFLTGDANDPKVMSGWLNIYTASNPDSPFTNLSARTQLLKKMKALLEKYKDEKVSVVVTGHSLGGCLATLSAFDLVENVVTNKDIPVTVVAFGCPRVGDQGFKDRVQKHINLRILHVKNTIDIIPNYPDQLLGYRNVGSEVVVDTRKCPILKASMNPLDWHNLQALLYVVAGWQGVSKEFDLMFKRSLALVNKSSDFLKDKYLVPASWWIEKNKSMVLGEDGDWALASPSEEDKPVPEEF